MKLTNCVVCGNQLPPGKLKYDTTECQKTANREAWLQKTYGISLQDFQKILDHQGNKCPICKRTFGGAVKPVTEHEHGGHVRGICCDHCNRRMIGRLKSWEKAQALADYLRDPPAVAALGHSNKAPGRPPQRRTRRRRR